MFGMKLEYLELTMDARRIELTTATTTEVSASEWSDRRPARLGWVGRGGGSQVRTEESLPHAASPRWLSW